MAILEFALRVLRREEVTEEESVKPTLTVESSESFSCEKDADEESFSQEKDPSVIVVDDEVELFSEEEIDSPMSSVESLSGVESGSVSKSSSATPPLVASNRSVSKRKRRAPARFDPSANPAAERTDLARAVSLGADDFDVTPADCRALKRALKNFRERGWRAFLDSQWNVARRIKDALEIVYQNCGRSSAHNNAPARMRAVAERARETRIEWCAATETTCVLCGCAPRVCDAQIHVGDAAPAPVGGKCAQLALALKNLVSTVTFYAQDVKHLSDEACAEAVQEIQAAMDDVVHAQHKKTKR